MTIWITPELKKLTVLILPFFLGYLSIVEQTYWLEAVILTWSAISVFFIQLDYLRRDKISFLWCLTFVYLSVSIISSIFNKTFSFGYSVIVCGQILSIILLISRFPKQMLRAICYINVPLVICNFISFLLSMDTLQQLRIGHTPILLGAKNRLAMVLLPIFILFVANAEVLETNLSTFKKNVLETLFICLTFFPILMLKSGTGIICSLCTIILYILYKTISLSYGWCISMVFAGNYLMLAIALNTNVIQKYIGDIFRILKKDGTFSGRVSVWEGTLELVKVKPFMGNGNGSAIYVKNNSGGFVTIFTEAHNSLLEILKNSGIIGLMLFILIVGYSIHKSRKFHSSPLYKLITVGIIVLFIAGMQESIFSQIWIWIFIAFQCNLEKIYDNYIETFRNRANRRRKDAYNFHTNLQ